MKKQLGLLILFSAIAPAGLFAQGDAPQKAQPQIIAAGSCGPAGVDDQSVRNEIWKAKSLRNMLIIVQKKNLRDAACKTKQGAVRHVIINPCTNRIITTLTVFPTRQ